MGNSEQGDQIDSLDSIDKPRLLLNVPYSEKNKLTYLTVPLTRFSVAVLYYIIKSLSKQDTLTKLNFF